MPDADWPPEDELDELPLFELELDPLELEPPAPPLLLLLLELLLLPPHAAEIKKNKATIVATSLTRMWLLRSTKPAGEEAWLS